MLQSQAIGLLESVLNSLAQDYPDSIARNQAKQRLSVVQYCINGEEAYWPKNWPRNLKRKIFKLSRTQQLSLAAALIIQELIVGKTTFIAQDDGMIPSVDGLKLEDHLIHKHPEGVISDKDELEEITHALAGSIEMAYDKDHDWYKLAKQLMKNFSIGKSLY